MTRPVPTPVLHFTHVQHLATIVSEGLAADTVARERGLLSVEVGHAGIKERRRRVPVPVPPGGVVGDYAPFYYAPRSPMMLNIHTGRVPTYTRGCDDLVYLVTTVERLIDLGRDPMFTDRNAAIAFAEFFTDLGELDTAIDWLLMRARMWNNTQDEPDRMERRMAECLVHQGVPWEAFIEVVAKTGACATEARAALATVGVSTPVVVRPGWYF